MILFIVLNKIFSDPNQQVIFKLSIENHKKDIDDLIIEF